jgi:uncharacterized protein
LIIDASIHPLVDDAELARLVGQPWAGGRFPHLLGSRYEAPFPELVVSPGQASDPDAVAALMLHEGKVDFALLAPLGRGLLPNPQQSAAVARAINASLAERWLSCPTADGRFVGSIRLPVTDVAAALTEIEDWADDRRFVQVVVPLRTFLPYGDDFYLPIWRAASERNLPVCIDDDLAAAAEHAETPIGRPRYFAERFALEQFAGFVHLSSLIASGVFDRLPELRFVFGDGGIDLARPLLWRLDKDWRSGRVEVPWVQRAPSEYVREHIRFVSQPGDCTVDGKQLDDDLIRISEAQNLVLFGSGYPNWTSSNGTHALAGWPAQARERVLGQNALEAIPRLASYIASFGEARLRQPASSVAASAAGDEERLP